MRFAFALLCLLAGQAHAADWYVRSGCGSNGDGTGSTCGSGAGFAWNSFANIVWGSMGSADTLYIIGSFTGNLDVQTGGNATTDFTIRGDHADAAGVISNGAIRWKTQGTDYITVDSMTISGTAAGVRYAWPVSKYNATNIEIIAPDKIRDADEGFISGGFVAGMQIQLFGGAANNRESYLISSVTNNPGVYDEITIDSSATALNALANEGPGASKNFEPYWPNQNITIQNSTISPTSDSNAAIRIRGINFSILNNEIDGGGVDKSAAIYMISREFWREYSSVTITGNYIHDVGVTSASKDNHCVGVQGADGLTVTKNKFETCGSGVVVFDGATSGNTDNYNISYNWFEGMQYAYNPTQWGGSAVIFTASTTANGTGTVSYNVMVDPVGCPGTDTDLFCRGVRSRFEGIMRVYNNTIVNYETGIVGKSAFNMDIRNNVVYNTGAMEYHIRTEETPTAHIENYNNYFSNVGNRFRHGATEYDYAGYNSAVTPETVNANSRITDPSLDAAHRLQAGSGAIDNGDGTLGAAYDDGISPRASWPEGPNDENVLLLDQDDYGSGWEIGAYVYAPRTPVFIGTP